MASLTSIAIARANVITRIDAALETLTQGSGHEYAPISTQGRDPQTLVNAQLSYIAESLEAIIRAPEFEIVDAVDGVTEELQGDFGKLLDIVENAPSTQRIPTPKPTAKGKG